MTRLARLTIPFSILLFVFSGGAAQTPQRDTRPRTASISGRVTISGKAAANAKVVVTEIKDRAAFGNQDFSFEALGSGVGEDYAVLTDADGRYRATGLPEGKYEVRVMLGSCVREASPNASLQEAVSLDEGQSSENVDFSLVRGGVITGRVTDANGRPLIAKVISLQAVDEQGRKTDARGSQNLMNLMMNTYMFQTDDRGVYRIFGLRAGRYLVGAGGESDGFTGAAGHSRTWYPAATDENQAKAIEVNVGDEVTGIDIRLGAAKKTYEALGRVVEDETGKPIAGAGVICMRIKGADDGAAIDGGGFGGFGGNAKTDEQGNFRLSGLAPGQYQLNLADLESFLTGGGVNYYSEGAKFEVQGGDVAGVEVRAKSGATISGVAVIDDADQSAKSSLSQTMLMAHSTPASPNETNENAIAFAMTPAASRIGSDGAFSIKGLRPGKVMIQAFSATGGALKIARIERGGVEMTDGIVVTGREEITGVRVVFGKGSGVIRGQVQVTGGSLPQGWRMNVTAHSEKSATGFDSSGGYAEVDSKGRFVIDGLLPGEYTLTLMTRHQPDPNTPSQSNVTTHVTQKVIVAKGQETQVTMTLDLSKKAQEGRQ